MEIGLVKRVNINSEMQQSYLDYAMSVIVSRALPDARDGLKPVHRRILYAMHAMGMKPNTPYKKSARIVGEVLGKYHPHGDSAVYDAMARMAQKFSMRNPLVDGQGNFGSVDGDPPAAMRYTEARLTTLAMEILTDLQKDTVDFLPNFDDTLTEPSVLPSAIPNLLVNGATGIAVGMATNIPPHNLNEVIDALNYMLEHWQKIDDISVDQLMKFIKGPDFPTGGVLVQEASGESLRSAYGSGRGRITLQARAHVEEMGRGRNGIIITELPYMTNKSSLIERIAGLVRAGKLEGLADLRDESDRQGMRIVLELTKVAEPEKVLQELYKRTTLRSTVSIIMLALVDGQPRLLSLKQSLRVYLEHRLTVVRRRSQFDLERARERAHILEGLRIALLNLDEVIAMIRGSKDADVARGRLRRRFKLSEVQAQAILNLPLRRLASLERKKIDREYKEIKATVKTLEQLLASPKKMRQVVAKELIAVKDVYGDRRRTHIVNLEAGKELKSAALMTSQIIPENDVWVMATQEGVIARTHTNKEPRRSGNHAPYFLVKVNMRDTLFLLNKNGQAASIAVHVLPEAENLDDGAQITQISPLKSKHPLAAVFSLPQKGDLPEEGYLVTVSLGGMLKKTAFSELPGPSAQTYTMMNVKEGDQLGWALFTHGSDQVLLLTAGGMAIRFSEDDVRAMGLVAGGVMGIKLSVGDYLVGAICLPKKGGEAFIMASDGKAKRVAASQFPTQGRYGMGVAVWKLPTGVKIVGMASGKGTQRVTLHLKKAAPKAVRLDAAPLRGRTAGGKLVQEVKPGDQVLALTFPQSQVAPLAKKKSVSKKKTAPKAKRSSNKK